MTFNPIGVPGHCPLPDFDAALEVLQFVLRRSSIRGVVEGSRRTPQQLVIRRLDAERTLQDFESLLFARMIGAVGKQPVGFFDRRGIRRRGDPHQKRDG